MSGLTKKFDESNLREYNGIMLGGDKVKAGDMIKDALEAKGLTQNWLAEQMGQAKQNLSKKLANNTISAREFIEAAAIMGCRVALIDTSNDEELRGRKRGIGPRVRQMAGGVIYDTYKADALCHTLPLDGWFMELYRDQEGRYFVAHYTEWKSGVNHISPCDEDDARRLYEEHGEDESAEVVFGIA